MDEYTSSSPLSLSPSPHCRVNEVNVQFIVLLSLFDCTHGRVRGRHRVD